MLVAQQMHNGGNHNTIVKEATKFLTEARDLEESVEDEGVFQYGRLPILMMVVRNMVPKVPGQDTSVYSNWHWKEGRKARHSILSVLQATSNTSRLW